MHVMYYALYAHGMYDDTTCMWFAWSMHVITRVNEALYYVYIVPKLLLVLIYGAQDNKVRQPIRIILLIALQAHSCILNLYIVIDLWASHGGLYPTLPVTSVLLCRFLVEW